MPAPRKYPDELRRRAIRLTPGRPGRPGPVQGVFQARGRRAGGRPRDPARPGSARGFGSVAGDRPGTTTEEARRTGELEKEVRGPGAGGAIGRSASACPWRRSSTARPADLPVHRPAQGGVRGRADLHRPDRVRVQDRPVHLLRRPQQAALQEVDLGRRPGREDPRPGGPSRSTRRWDPGRPGGCSTPGRRAPGWPAAPRERRMRAPESDRRRAGQDGAHHRARQGEPGPRSARCAATSPPPAQTGAGWSTSPTCRPGRGSATPPSSWTCSPAGSSAGPPAAAWTPTTRSAPWSRRSGSASTATAATSRAWSTTATTDPSHLSIAYTGRLVDEGTGRIGRSRGLLLRQRRRRGPGQVLQARARLARRPLEGPRRPRDRHRPVGELVQPHPTPPRQPRRPLTRRRRTPLPSQPHHHRRGTRHGITNPPQNPGRSTPPIQGPSW